ncbi:MAG: Asp23/Gls24 family envelope stress response protein [Atopobiaceae bacterium]|jgi:uncharacterized alkaline shock family protein YloU|nr:Asp23/Gls24 family envelope stress response protein [Atopobiaceae bacterium]MCH4180456.1 Asp23/Gls24 family envelope stress response protein [Atopobiaceae bacterium]MCH4214589.1 Asp23/Gls24 family envelope stress response protein [Atopobiaceae bacterium]MCH4229505.1 Asp23/Gls24 family envelope stress response protein [Atopobiaceae bacterium]MCH4275816.1 Asp23/Gls24 family envelope stress response protein [Atopobiaceae bacterium]
MDNELHIAGIAISKDVVAAIVSQAAQRVEGVASVDGQSLASGLISIFTTKPQTSPASVDSEVIDDKLHVTVRVAVFFGYPFMKLAEDVRTAVAAAVHEQIGVEVSSVDVTIDSIVFPKE